MHRFDVKTIKILSYVAKHSKQRKTTKVNIRICIDFMIKTIKTTKWSNYNELHRFDVITIKMLSYVAKHSKQRKTTKVIKLRWICIDFMSKRSKQLKTTKTIKLQWIASIWRHNDKKCWVTSQCIQNNAKLQKWSYIRWICIDFMSKRSKQLKTTKTIKLQWIASIWRQNDQKCWVTSQNIQNKAKLQK